AMCDAPRAVQPLAFPHDAEPAAPKPRATRIASQRYAMHADRCIELERLRREVHAVGGIRLDGVDAILAGAGAGAAGDQLARDEARAVGPFPAERQHQQLAAAVGGPALPYRLR